ncbi:hypothetical protein H9P43_007454 [Blastocladiella emersonii ATCC 22665]|nr:hypothetical protein H9P43_007454 [Blastocladiella emersonii ATCC 22665]
MLTPLPDALITLAEDNSIGVVRPSDGSLLWWIPNHAEIPTELAWRDDLVVAGYRRDHAHVWGTRDGILDWVPDAEGRLARRECTIRTAERQQRARGPNPSLPPLVDPFLERNWRASGTGTDDTYSGSRSPTVDDQREHAHTPPPSIDPFLDAAQQVERGEYGYGDSGKLISPIMSRPLSPEPMVGKSLAEPQQQHGDSSPLWTSTESNLPSSPAPRPADDPPPSPHIDLEPAATLMTAAGTTAEAASVPSPVPLCVPVPIAS